MNKRKAGPDLESLAQTVPGVIYRIDLSAGRVGRVVFLNAKMKELCGYPSSDFLSGKVKWFDLVAKEDLPIVKKTIEVSSPNKAYRLEYRIRHKKGDIRWVLNQGYISVAKGKPVWSDGMILDISQSKKNELSLRESEKLLNLTSRIAKIGGWEIELKTKNIHWSAEIFRIWEIDTPVEHSLKEALNHYTPEARPIIKAAIDKAIEKGVPWDLELPLITAKGNRKWIRDVGLPEMINGKCIRLHGTLQDITEKKNAELFLVERDLELDLALKGAEIGLWHLNNKTGKLKFSGSWSDITGYTQEEVNNIKSDKQFIHPDDLDKVRFTRESHILDKTSQYEIEYRFKHKKGHWIWILSKGKIVERDTQGSPLKISGTHLDITKRKNDQEKLIASEKRLEYLLSASPTIIFSCKPQDNFDTTFISKNVEDILGHQPDEFIKDPTFWIRHVHPDDLPAVKENEKNLISLGYVMDEYRFLSKTGEWHWMRDELVLVRNEHNQPAEIVGSWTDITNRKKNEDQIQYLNKELRKFRMAIDTASIVSIADSKGNIVYANEKFTEISQYSKQELMGRSHTIITSGFHPKSFWAAMWKTVGSGKVWRAEVKNKRRDGSFYWVDTFIIPIKNDAGNITEYISIRNDITQKKKDEENLHLLSLVASQTTNYVIITDHEGRIEWVNKSFEDFTGYALHEITGKRPGSFLQGPETLRQTRQYIAEMMRKKEPYSCEILNYKKQGEPYWVQMNCQPVSDENGNVVKFFAIMRNITELKRLIQDLETARHKAEESDRLKSAFLANISHEIRTPMNAIMGFSELLDKPNIPEEKRAVFSQLIHDRSVDLLNIVNDILDISKIEAGHISSAPVVGNIAELFERLLLTFHAETYHLRNKKIVTSVTNELKGDENIVLADFLKLNQVLTNLLTNAAKFTKAGAIQFGCQLLNAQELVFAVRDTGIGIPPSQQDVIFKPFHQANSIIHQQYGGSGLGLAICKGLVELWGGRIWVESKLNEGSAFYFTLPYIPATTSLII